MAAFMPTGERGFTYLGVLLLIAVSGMALASAGTLWSTQAQRERERQLLWVGGQYAQALRSYFRASPGLAQYPPDLRDLLEDRRFPNPRRHLRRLYPDPVNPGGEWALVRTIDGRISGVHSQSDALPRKQAGFDPQWSDFEGLSHYSDWQFVAEKAFVDTPGARRSPTTARDTP